MGQALRRLQDAFTDALFPRSCGACGRLFQKAPAFSAQARARRGTLSTPVSSRLFERLTAGVLCPDCRGLFHPLKAPFCRICGIPFISPQGGSHICGACLESRPHYTSIRSAGAYDGVLKTLIHALKYRGRLQVAEPLGKLLFHALIRYPEIPAPDLVLPVPLHPSRAKRRGFNQAALLVKNWPKLFAARGLVPPRIGLDPRLIRRIQDTPAQTGLSRSMRKTNLRQAFAVHPKQNMEGLEILLVDDVATTGETVNECARILKKAGASGVNGLTLARAS